MKMPKHALLSVLAAVLICSFAATAYANYNYQLTTNNDGPTVFTYNYQLTSNYPGTVPLGTSVTTTATTNNNVMTTVFFTWTNPANQNPINNVSVSVHNGVPISTYTPDALGNWTVTAIFVGPGVEESATITMTVENINVIPEVPILGTAGVLIAMMIGLVYIIKRKPTKKTTTAKYANLIFYSNDTIGSFSE